MEWVWLREHVLLDALDHCRAEHRDDILDALDDVLADPLGDMTTEMRGNRDHADRRIAFLPHGWVLVFRALPGGALNGPRRPSLVVVTLDWRYPLFD